ncbi:MAG: AAA family ATPase [Methylacidiphilales bacterium]|nr:AAA family ATPase [Candidatus Methylacidiphilales bacterium]NJR16732.1 AAA family ATPase [Calothrix sp. CSU_2_0]
MVIDLQRFYRATNPSKILIVENTQDQKYYIDFSSARGGKIIEELRENITFFSPEEPTCQLFTGHIGCGKTTELLRLKLELEKENFHVVYFESSEDLEMADVDIGDFLLAIAHHVSESLANLGLNEPSKLKELVQGAWKILNSEVTGAKAKIPGVGDVGFTSEKDKFSLSIGIGEITSKAKNDATLRERLNQYLAPQKNRLLEAINSELLEPAISKLKQQHKNGLVVIVDNLDRIDSRPKPWGRPQQEYLFIDQSECLTKLHCHLVYTMPLALKFSNDYNNLTQRFPEDPKVLPMVTVHMQDGSNFEPGLVLLRQMVLARAFPELKPCDRISHLTKIFDFSESLDRLCYVSGGHVRDLLRLLNNWIQRERKLPLQRGTLETLIRVRRNEMTMQISDDEWDLLRQVRKRKKVGGDRDYQALVHSRLVFEYRNHLGESWFDVNPILMEAEELNS